MIDTAKLSTPERLPFWAQPLGVHVVAGVYFLVFGLIATFLHSSLGVDNAIENYNAQSLEFSYSGRNPPLYDWLLYGLQRAVGPGRAGFAILNYGALYLCAILAYRIAAEVIFDPRLQALSVYALSLLWDIGHEAHRILTHSNFMVAAIMATVLVLVRLRRERSLALYVALGFCALAGILSKFGFLVFLATAGVAMAMTPGYRSVLFDRRIFATLLVASAPLAALYGLTLSLDQSIADETGRVLTSRTSAGFLERAVALVRALFGYVLPLAPIAFFVFFLRPATSFAELSSEARDFRRFVLLQLGLGVLVAVLWVLVLGATQVKPRYFHALLLLFPISVFVVLQSLRWTGRQARTFLFGAGLVAAGVIVEQAVATLAPTEALCGSCRRSAPHDRLGEEIQQRFGRRLTVVALDAYRAGQLRAGLAEARVVTVSQRGYRPPPASGLACIAVWGDDLRPAERARMEAVAASGGASSIELTVPWFEPLSRAGRTSRFTVQPLPAESALCR